MRQKLVSDYSLILVNNQKQLLHPKNSFENMIFWKGFKKLTLFFRLNPVLFTGQNHQKRKGPGTSDQLLSTFWNKFRKILLLVMYYLTKFDDVI